MTSPLPPNITFGTVHGRFGSSALLSADGVTGYVFTPLAGLIVTFTPTAPAIADRTSSPPVTIITEPTICTIDENTGYLLSPNGDEGVQLIATDNVNISPNGWTYHISYSEAESADLLVESDIAVPAGSDRALAVITPVPGSPGSSLSEAVAAEMAAAASAASAISANAAAATLNSYAPVLDPAHPGLYSIPTSNMVAQDPAHPGLYLLSTQFLDVLGAAYYSVDTLTGTGVTGRAVMKAADAATARAAIGAGTPSAGGTDVLLLAALDPDSMFTGSITSNASGAPTASAVKWPDGTTGAYTGVASTAFPAAVDSYVITYGSPVSKTYTQPTVTRNGSGYLTTRPALVLT